MSQQQEPDLRALAVEEARVRKDLEQVLLARYSGMAIEGLEQLVDDPSSLLSLAQREEIRRFLVLGKRLAKAKLERQERIGDVYEKSGLPMAVTGFPPTPGSFIPSGWTAR